MVSSNRPTPDDAARRGEELYERTIRAQVEPQHHGRILALDCDTGDYEIADEVVAAVRGLRRRRPVALPYILRVGFPAVFTLGARLRAVPQ